MSDHDKDVEIVALRRQITVLQRRLGTQKLRFDPADAVAQESEGVGLVRVLPSQGL